MIRDRYETVIITSIEVIKKESLGGTYFRHIYFCINSEWYRKSWIEFDKLKNIDKKYYCSNFCHISINRYKVRCGRSLLRFWENKDWVNSINPNGWFEWYFRYWLAGRSLGNKRQTTRWKGILSRLKEDLIKMINDANGRFDYYSTSLKIRQILLDLGHELVEDDL